MATPRARQFEIVGVDGGPIRGDLATSGNGEGMPAVVISHGFKGFKDWGFFPKIAERLAGAGITAVRFNFSGSGVGPDLFSFSEPERFRNNTHSGQLSDLKVVIDGLQEGMLVEGVAPPSALGLLGFSMGGATSILTAAGRTGVRALVTWSAVSRLKRWDAETLEKWQKEGHLDIVNARTGEVLPLGYGFIKEIDEAGESLDPLAGAARVTSPWLVVHCSADETVPIAEAELLAKAGPTAELREIAGGSHTFEAAHPWAGMTRALSEAFDSTIEHFAQNLT